jgi:hypothetical protein
MWRPYRSHADDGHQYHGVHELSYAGQAIALSMTIKPAVTKTGVKIPGVEMGEEEEEDQRTADDESQKAFSRNRQARTDRSGLRPRRWIDGGQVAEKGALVECGAAVVEVEQEMVGAVPFHQ